MKHFVGVWVDHRRAVVVTLENGAPSIQTIASEVEKHTRLAGGSRAHTPYGPQGVVSESSHEHRHQQQLTSYYDALIHLIQDAAEILIFGPGEAKTELSKAIAKDSRLRGRIVAVEPADKMTTGQIVAVVKERFGKP